MTDKEIITGLERCITGGCGCTGCAYNKISYYDCDYYLKKDALSLIKSQQAEIEKARAEAIKEFAERLGDYKEYRYNENCDFVPYVRLSDIEKVEKEMVGAENET